MHWPITVRSLEEARYLVDSFDQKISRWHERAVAVVEGNARLRPGLLVDVVQNSNYYNPSNGKWMVAAVDQILENEKLRHTAEAGSSQLWRHRTGAAVRSLLAGTGAA